MKLDFFDAAPRPLDEPERQAEVDRYPAEAFTDPEIAAIVAEAQALSGATIAALSIIDGDRQRLFNVRGCTLTETPRATAICAHSILTTAGITSVTDLTADPRFAANPLVTGELNLRFYAGAPVCAENGAALGALCVIDQHVQPALSADQAEALRSLAARVAAVLARHRTA